MVFGGLDTIFLNILLIDLQIPLLQYLGIIEIELVYVKKVLLFMMMSFVVPKELLEQYR